MDAKTQTLDTLLPGQIAIVTSLTAQGPERRRLMDLGILPGTAIQVELTNPLGDPTAYLIRGALVALRREQARHIHITLQDAPEEVSA